MKRCPTCNRTYEDGSLNYCLADGAPLASDDSEATVVIPRPGVKKKSRLLIWIGLGFLAVAALVLVLAGTLIYKFSASGNKALGNKQTNRQASPESPKPAASPTATSDPATSEDPIKNAEPTPSIDGEDDEVTPILWETTAGGFKGTPGKTYTFQCPADGTERPIWGSDVYTDFSSICTAAVHVGAITLKHGGIVTIEYRPGRSIYGSTERNEVKSNTMGEHSRSFVIRRSSDTN